MQLLIKLLIQTPKHFHHQNPTRHRSLNSSDNHMQILLITVVYIMTSNSHEITSDTVGCATTQGVLDHLIRHLFVAPGSNL